MLITTTAIPAVAVLIIEHNVLIIGQHLQDFDRGSSGDVPPLQRGLSNPLLKTPLVRTQGLFVIFQNC